MGLLGQIGDAELPEHGLRRQGAHHLCALGVHQGGQNGLGAFVLLADEVFHARGQYRLEILVNGLGGGGTDVFHRVLQAGGQNKSPFFQRQHAQGLVGGKPHVGVLGLVEHQLFDARNGRRVPDVPQHIQGVHQKVRVIGFEVAQQNRDRLCPDARQFLFGAGPDMGVMGNQSRVQRLQGFGDLDAGEQVQNGQIEKGVFPHALKQPFYRRGRRDAAQARNGRGNQGPVRGIQIFRHVGHRHRVSNGAQGLNGRLQAQGIAGSGENVQKRRDGRLQLELAGASDEQDRKRPARFPVQYPDEQVGVVQNLGQKGFVDHRQGVRKAGMLHQKGGQHVKGEPVFGPAHLHHGQIGRIGAHLVQKRQGEPGLDAVLEPDIGQHVFQKVFFVNVVHKNILLIHGPDLF